MCSVLCQFFLGIADIMPDIIHVLMLLVGRHNGLHGRLS